MSNTQAKRPGEKPEKCLSQRKKILKSPVSGLYIGAHSIQRLIGEVLDRLI